MAVAAGDGAAAARWAAKADGLLDDPSLTLLLSAQAAQLSGDEGAAADRFRAMRTLGAEKARPDMAFVGLRGLAAQALAAGDTGRALALAREAAVLRPKARWPLQTQLELEARAGDWTAATAALDQLTAAKVLAGDTLRRHRAALLVERSRAAAAEGALDQALAQARKAHDLEPASVPAAVQAARLLAATGSAKAATRVLEQAWHLAPHPDLAEAWGLTGEKAGDDPDPLARVKRLEALVALDPDSADAHLALARAAIDARLWGVARGHLKRVLATRPGARVHRLLAALAEAEHGPGAEERGHLADAAHAAADPAWVCTACGGVNAVWGASCGQCGGFDTLAWRLPAGVDSVVAGPAALPTAKGGLGRLVPRLSRFRSGAS